ncbi:MAG: hypothetical protein EHM23_30675, partial [Acidobacteria bacterium]
MADLRLIDGSGTEISYILQKAETRTFRSTLPTSIINRGIDPGRFEQIVCDVGKRVQVSNQVVLYTQTTNFVRKTDVGGSADGKNWIIIRSNAYIFDQRYQGRELHNLVVSYPDSTYRYLKIMVWFDGGAVRSVTLRRMPRLLIFSGSPGERHRLFFGNAEGEPRNYDLG